ncbi:MULTISPECIES: TIGR02556 family CRISPR-associated protein [Thermodesulfovibrio]|jgi:CRISPR-associated protein Csh1|uniref:TIGR02556 family CRISPR-associated protein n=1 Tax=Thermodesulfovibrio TaxID=28261 RepID=UPI00260834A4|nr:TIGR02556 family CRISPR-associated protein [Thermodesulfovibrio sp.]
MIESLLQIGKELLREQADVGDFVRALAEDISKEKNNKKQHLVILNISRSGDLESYSLDIELEEISDETPVKYLWVGNSPSNSEQDKLTTNNLEYLISQTIPNLIKKLPDCDLKETLKKLKESIYFDLGDKESISSTENQYERYRYIWDLSKIGMDFYPEKVINKVKEEYSGRRAKKAVEIVSNELMNHIKKETNLNKNEISLFTLSLNGQLLINYDNYQKYIYSSLIDDIFINNKDEGLCHVCGSEGEVTWNTTKFWFKFYITDKVGFSSNLKGNKNFLKNYAICRNCYESILAAESFIKNKMKIYFAKSNVYILPAFHLSQKLPFFKIERWSNYFKDKFSASASLGGLHEFQKRIEDYIIYENYQDNFMLNFLFAEKKQAELKVYQLIQDVPPSRLDEIREKAIEVQNLGFNIFNDRNMYLSLGKIYYLFSIGKSISKKTKFTLTFYYQVFSNIPFHYQVLIKEFIERIREIRFDTDFKDYNFSQTLVFQNLLLIYLEKLKLLDRGERMNDTQEYLSSLELDENITTFLRESKYSEQMASLFLLGLLIGEIGAEQYKKGDKKKAILNKVSFQGMDLNKLIRLFNDVYEKMRQYRILISRNEKIYCLAKNLFETNKLKWSLTPQDNVFYVLSGYSFKTYKAIISGIQKESLENKEEEANGKE